MKKIILISTFLIALNTLVSAQKIHFTDSNNIWHTTSRICNVDLDIYTTYSYTRDTIMAGNFYRYLQGVFDTTAGSFPFRYGYWIREDTTANIVYVWYNDSDKILYNYNLLVGDTQNYMYQPPYHKYIDTIIYVDITTINSNNYRVWSEDELVMFDHRSCSNNHGTSFIEGIGSVLGPLSPIDTLDSLHAGPFLCVFYRTIDTLGLVNK